MPVFTYGKQLSKSITLPEGQLTKKKTFFFTSSQRERHSNDKLSSSNFSSGFKPKVPRHLQDKDCDVLFTSCDQTNAREIGNFKQAHRKQRKMQEIVGATKSDGYKRRIMKKKLQTEEDKFGNHHTYQDHMVNEIWYEHLWRELKKQAKKVANSNADADSSSDESMSIKTHATKRPSDSTRIKLEKIIASDKKTTFPSSEGVKIESWENVSYSKIVPTTDVSSHLSSPKQGSLADLKLLGDIITTSEKTGEKPVEVGLTTLQHKALEKSLELKNEAANFKRAYDSHGTRRPSDSTRNNFEKLFVSNENLAFQFSKGVEVNHVSQKRDKYDKIEQLVQANIILDNNCVYKHPAVSSYPSTPNQNINNQEMRITHGNENRDVAENHQGNGEHLVTSQNLDAPTTQDQMQDEDRLANLKLLVDIITTSEKTGEKPVENRNYEERCITQGHEKKTQGNEKKNRDVAENHQGNGEHMSKILLIAILMMLIILLIAILVLEIIAFLQLRLRDRNIEEGHVTQGHQKGNEDEKEETGEKLQETGANQVTSENLDMHSTMDQIQDERHNSTGAPEESTNRPIHPDDHRTTHDSQENNRIGMPGCMTNTDASSDESLSTVESTRIRLYPNIIRNETYRMMSSIDMVISEAEDLFGLERSRIFFDLLASELCYFGSTRAISEFVPNMVESTVRKNIISFFEHPCDMMNILMTLLLRCPDSERSQQLSMQNFISLMKSVITSSLKTKSKGRKKKLSLEGNIYIMVDPKEFERSLGEEIPEDVLNRFRRGDEMVVHKFIDTRPERHQPSDRRENRPIHSIYFPSDCRLFIYIPTETGSYWHQLDMQRANRISKYHF